MKKMFAVKTFYITEAVGRAKLADKNYKKGIALYEERVVLFFAKNFDEAIKKAEEEARQYAKYSFSNIYKQKVKTKYLDACDAFEIYDSLKNGAELYSMTHVWKKGSLNKLLDEKMGGISDKKEKILRINFSNEEFNTKAK